MSPKFEVYTVDHILITDIIQHVLRKPLGIPVALCGTVNSALCLRFTSQKFLFCLEE